MSVRPRRRSLGSTARDAGPTNWRRPGSCRRWRVQAAGVPGPVRDPRLSPAGNRLARQRGMLLDLLSRLENGQRHPGLAELTRDDRRLLAPRFIRLAGVARRVAELVEELWQAQLPE